MAELQTEKIAYLFGAGATCAELSDTDAEYNNDDIGLSIGEVTRRVLMEAKKDPDFLKDYPLFLERAADSSNIELFISLIENNQYDIKNVSEVVNTLRDLVENDIKKILIKERTEKFYLHKALFELHQHNKKESICGIISLNYDTILDEAYELFHDKPNYNFSFPKEGVDKTKPSLLKLHGSFNWNEVEINGRKRKIPIIPLGVNKNYLRLPYNFIWGRALEILAECDKLRVIGCSLSQNDIHLIDLLFKAHLERDRSFEIEIITSEITGTEIKDRYAFFPKITSLNKIEEPMMSEVKDNANFFKEWLKAKTNKFFDKEPEKIEVTTYLKKLKTHDL